MKGRAYPSVFLLVVIGVAAVTAPFILFINANPTIITIDGDLSDWESIDPVYVDEIGDTQPWSKNMILLSVGNTSEAGLSGAPFDAARDLEAFYVFADANTIYLRLDVAGLPSYDWGYGGLNASAYHVYFDTDRLEGSGQMIGSSASDMLLPSSAYWERHLSWAGSYALLQDENWGYVDGTYGRLSLAQNITVGAFELCLPRSDFPAEWDGNTLRIVVMALKPGESYGYWGNWLHTFDPQAPGTPGEIAGNPGLPAKGGDAADVIPGGAGAIISPSTEDWDMASKVEAGLDVDTTRLAHGLVAYFDCSPIAPNPGETVTFNASGSLPSWDGIYDVSIVSYAWDFGGGITATGAIVYHTYNSEGSYAVTLNVTDSRGLWDAESKTVIVREPLSWLHVDGKWVKDEEGDIVLLRGCDYTGAESGWFYHQESDYARIKSWGFNVVRQPIAWTFVEPIRGYYDESYLKYVDQLVGWCKKYGLYMVLDMHQWEWAPRFGGNGLPDWATTEWSTQEEAKVGFWNNETLKGYFYEMWKYVAARYANESTIAAYDLFNEANPPNLANIFYEFYNRPIEAIRTVDSQHILMYMPPWGGADPFEKINQPNLIFSTHVYTGGTWDGFTGYNGDINMLEQDMYRGYSKAVLEWNMPLWIGEFGIGATATKAVEWATDMLSLMDKYMIGSVWWSYWRDEQMGLLYADGQEKEMFTSILDRPYPIKCSAEPARFSYQKGLYDCIFTIDFQPSGGETIWVALHVPQFFEDFTVSSNASECSYSWDLENRVVNVTVTSENAFEVTLDRVTSAKCPIANFSAFALIGHPIYADANSTVKFDASESLQGWNGTHYMPIVSYQWDFGDGNITTVTQPFINHAYAGVGNYTVTLSVTDIQGLWNVTTVKITVTLRADTSHDGTVDILDLSIVALAFGSNLGESRWNAAADLDGNGLIDIVDITLVAKDFGKTA
ncbi:MAG TPA: cellulase family glycosylhydrolase [Candidatus Bathyarchaeia archaeon]